MADRSVKVYLKGDVGDFNRAMLEAEAASKGLDKTLNTSNDRMSNLVQTSLALGPALVPISAAAIPAVTGLANQLGIGVAAAGVAVLAFKGLGKALDAVNTASLEPTAANIQKMNLQMSQLGPSGQDFVLFLQRARPEIQHLQELARAGLFPGIEQGLKSMSGLLPDVEHVISTISSALGDLAKEAGTNLAGPKWREFIAFIDKEARPTLLAMGRTLGNFATGLANLWMAFAPLSNNFSQSFLGLSRDFAKWTDGLDKTQGFKDFLAYLDKTGPQVWATLGALGNALVQIVVAAAPIGTATLPVIKAVANAVALLASSDLGPVIIGIVSVASALGRLKAVGVAANSGFLGGLMGKTAYAGTLTAAKQLPASLLAVESAAERANTKAGALSATSLRLGASLKGAAKVAGGAAGLAFIMSGTADKMHLSNTATLAMAGSLAGPWGAAMGAGVGLAKDFNAQADNTSSALDKLKQKLAGANFADQGRILAAARSQYDALYNKTSGPVRDVLKPYGAGLAEKESAHRAAAKAAQDQAFAEAGLSSQMAGASKSARDETYALIENIRTKNAAADAADNAFSAETNYRQALKDAAAQAASNNAGINGNTDAALKNRSALSQVASAWNAVADAGNATQADMDKAKSSFIRLAVSMGVPLSVARTLADQMLHMPDAKPKITVQGQKAAAAAIKAIQDLLSHLPGSKKVYIDTYHRTFNINGGTKKGSLNAAGGYITGPGTTTSDDIPAWLSNKEYVINAASVAKYGRKMFDNLNAGTFAHGGMVQRFAAGGQASGPAAMGGFTFPDMPIVDGSQVIGYLRDVATSRARIEIARHDLAGAMTARLG